MVEDWQHGGFGLYVHWPFCAAKCPYCDFNSHVVAEIDEDRWTAAYLAELDRHAAITGRRVLRSIFFGGGTPSLMKPDTVAKIIERAADHWDFANDIEITLEANPTSTERAKFEGFRSAGVNRVSLGLQALNDPDLRKLGRMHSAAEGLAAYETAQAVFDRVSFDLIYARQDQNLADWQAELAQALALKPDHLSLYQLTIEPGTAFGDRAAKGGLRGLPGEDLSSDQFELTQDLCDQAGLAAYEVSNHSLPGAESRHNLIYWSGGDYVGVGPGAHGRITKSGKRHATVTHLAPGKWLAAVETTGSGNSVDEALGAEDQAGELLMMGLRTVDGVSLDRYSNIAKRDLIVPDELVDLELVVQENGQLKTTLKGRMVLNYVVSALLP